MKIESQEYVDEVIMKQIDICQEASERAKNSNPEAVASLSLAICELFKINNLNNISLHMKERMSALNE